jgi:hypothetical protein
MKTTHLLAAAAVFTALAGAAAAQDTGATPNYSTLTLNAGFASDPRTVSVRAGGDINAQTAVSDTCRGFITNAPDVRLNYEAGSLPLIISVNASSDTTLVVNGPNGDWYCDDDSGEGTNPSVRFNGPVSGRYEIWIGTYRSGASQPATLYVSELNSQ